MIKKVTDAIGELDYRPSAIARCLRMKETKTIGVIISTNLNPYFAEVIQGIEDSCFEKGYSVIVCYSNFSHNNELNYINNLIEREVDGIIIDSITNDEKIIKILNKINIPIVMIDRYLENLNIDFIHTDDYTGGYIGTDYLIKLGHEKIACVSGISFKSHSFYQRYFGYEKAFKENNLKINNEYIITKYFQLSDGFETLKELMSLKEKPTAIFYFGDIMAIGALSSANKLGFKVPDDISILGYDDIEMTKYTIPPLTTIAQEKYELGKKSVERIIDKLNTDKKENKRIIIKPELIIRESCCKI